MRFNVQTSVLVIGVAASCILSAPVPDDSNQSLSSTTTTSSVPPTNTPNSFSNSNNIIGPVNNNQNSNKNNNQNNNFGNGDIVTIPVEIDRSMLQSLLSGGSVNGNNNIQKNVVSTSNQLPPNAIPFNQFVQANGGNIPPPNANNVHIIQAGTLPSLPKQALVNTGNNDPSPPAASSSTSSSSTSTTATSTPPPPPPPPSDDSDSGSGDKKPQKRQELQIRNSNHDHNANVNDPSPDMACSKRDGCTGYQMPGGAIVY